MLVYFKKYHWTVKFINSKITDVQHLKVNMYLHIKNVTKIEVIPLLEFTLWVFYSICIDSKW